MSLLGPNYKMSLDEATPGSGPVSTATSIAPDMRTKTYLSLDNNIRSKVDNNKTPTINVHRKSAQQYLNNNYVNFTDREQINPTLIEQTGLKGNNIWNNLTYNDSDGYRAAKTTTNETTNFSYSGNAEREDVGGNWWRYSDAPKTTTNETTNFSYSGDIAPATTHIQSNRSIFTGDGNTSGVTKWNQKGITLVENYEPGPNGSINIQLDAKDKIGESLLKEDCNEVGSGTYNQSIPNGTNYQQVSKGNIGKVSIPANKYVNEDERQVQNYVVENLTKNPLSVYRNKENDLNKIPLFFVDSNLNESYQKLDTDNNSDNPLLYR